ncbi:MAG: chloride channel protein [Chitinophagaceae bacterium]|nr:MAG: chloride channel protein [Chitinophagaceae bacterium]
MKGKRWQLWRQRLAGMAPALWGHPLSRRALLALPLWIASLATGLVAVGYTRLFGWAEALLQGALHQHFWYIFLLSPLFYLLSWACVQWLAPAARGSGIPQVMAAIDLATPAHDQKINRLLSLRIAAVKVLSSVGMVLGGGAIGREGPTIQIAGSLFRTVNRLIPASWPRLSSQSYLLTGAAAGLAAAFNTPLGGLVFAVEELARVHVRFFRTALFTAIIIAGLTAQALLGPYLYLGYPDVHGLSFRIFLAVLLVGALAGLVGSLLCTAILRVMAWKRTAPRFMQPLYVVVAGLLMAALAFYVNPSVLGSGKELINRLLFTPDKHCGADMVLLRFLGPLLCFNTGAAGGVFAPSLAGGAAIGGWMASLFDVLGSKANILVLAGMVGFLTGVTRTPFTSAILVLEMTDRHSVIFHLLLAAMVANMVASIIDKRSLYEHLKGGYKVEAGADADTEPGEEPERE